MIAPDGMPQTHRQPVDEQPDVNDLGPVPDPGASSPLPRGGKMPFAAAVEKAGAYVECAY